MSSRTLSDEIRRHLALGELSEALLLLKAAAISYPGSRFFAEKLTLTAYQAGDFATSRDAWERARRLGSDARPLLLLEADLLLQQGDQAAAAATAKRLLADDPQDEDALRAALAVLERLQDPAAASCWTALARVTRLSTPELLHAAATARAAGDLAGAGHHLASLMAREPRHRGALIEQTSLWLEAPEEQGRGGIAAMRSLAAEDLDAAIALLPFLLRRQRWDALLELAILGAGSASAGAAFEAIAAQLAEQLRLVDARQDHGAACQLLTAMAVMADGAGGTDAPLACATLRQRAALAAQLGTEKAAATLAEGRQGEAARQFRILLATAEAGGPAPQALAALADRLEEPELAARAWLCIWRATGEDALLDRMADAGRLAASPGAALVLYTSIPGLPRGHPVIAAHALKFAREADRRLLESDGGIDADVAAARVLLAPDAPPEWPRRGAREYLQRLRQAVKLADQQGDAVAAIAAAEAAVALDPDRAYPFKVLARLYGAAGQPSRARACLRRLTELEPENADHALRFARRCPPGEAEVLGILIRAIERHPGHPEVQVMLDQWVNDAPAAAQDRGQLPS